MAALIFRERLAPMRLRPQQVRQPGNVRRDPPRLIPRQQLRRCSPTIKDARSFAWREKLYGHGFFDCLVHFTCGHEDDYFTRYNKATLVGDH